MSTRSDETTETDPSALLEQLAECLLGNGSDGTALGSTDTATMEACAHFQACRGFPAVMSWLTESYRDQVTRMRQLN